MNMEHDGFSYSEEKDRKLRAERGIGFEDVITVILDNKKVQIVDHPNLRKYPNQKIYVLEIDDYIWTVPFEIRGDMIHLCTIFANRKLTKYHKKGKL